MKTAKRILLTFVAPIALTLSPMTFAQGIDALNPLPEVPPTSIAIQADGRILIGGSFASVGSSTLHGVARLNVDGSVDATFSDPGVDSEVKTIAVQSDGKLLIGGSFLHAGGQPRHAMARLNADGTLDTSFADPNLDGDVWALAVQPDGKVLVGGDFTHVGSLARNYFVRFDANGGFDATFADPQLCCLPARAVALQADGHVLIGGSFSQAGGVTHFYLARYSSNGTFDPAFPETNGPFSAIVVAPEGSILLNGGYLTSDGANIRPVVRLSSSGVLDPTFGDLHSSGATYSLGLQPNGKVLIAGTFEMIGAEPRHGTARLDANGTLDSSFGDLNFSFDAGDANGYVYGIAAQADGRILAIGNFTLADGLPRQYFARVVTGDFATSVLVVQPNGTSVTATWYRLGDGPELAQAPTLMSSADGVNFSAVGPMTRIANGWQASASHDVHGARFYLQAIGTTSNGAGNGAPGKVASDVYSSDTIFANGFE